MSDSPFSKTTRTATSRRLLDNAGRQKKESEPRGPAAKSPEDQAKDMAELRQVTADKIIDSYGLILTPKQHDNMVIGAEMDSKGDFQVFKVSLYRRVDAWYKNNPDKVRVIPFPAWCANATALQLFCDEVGTTRYIMNEIMGTDYQNWPKDRAACKALAIDRINHRRTMEIAESKVDKESEQVPPSRRSRRAEEEEAEQPDEEAENGASEGPSGDEEADPGIGSAAPAESGPSSPNSAELERAYRNGYQAGLLAKLDDNPPAGLVSREARWVVWADVPTGRQAMPKISVTAREGISPEALAQGMLEWYEGAIAGIKLINQKYPQPKPAEEPPARPKRPAPPPPPPNEDEYDDEPPPRQRGANRRPPARNDDEDESNDDEESGEVEAACIKRIDGGYALYPRLRNGNIGIYPVLNGYAKLMDDFPRDMQVLADLLEAAGLDVGDITKRGLELEMEVHWERGNKKKQGNGYYKNIVEVVPLDNN